MSHIQQLETERLVLGRLRESDFDVFLELQTGPAIRKFLGGPVPKDLVESKFKSYLSSEPPTFHFTVRLKADSSLIGIVSLGKYHDGLSMEISFQFLDATWGNGYAVEASRAVLSFANDTLGICEVVAETQCQNMKAKSLLLKLGMREVDLVERFGASQSVFSTAAESGRVSQL